MSGIIKRECDIAMARKKKLLPCDKDCKRCMACVEITDTGERRHCSRHKSNTVIDMKIATAGLEPEQIPGGAEDLSRAHKRWSEQDICTAVQMRKSGCALAEIGKQLKRTVPSVQMALAKARREGLI